ncbi:MAG: hypothetical protein KatS3mg077_1199 [Candidatus Binatia bacterium]|nr:MAG: hypothetical protein KatS3mg077_1199 [Candidatus Binatia bacterium]
MAVCGAFVAVGGVAGRCEGRSFALASCVCRVPVYAGHAAKLV